jgi:hypothetical protein
MESPLDRDDVTAIHGAVQRELEARRDHLLPWGSTMKRKKSRLTRAFWERDRANMRLLQDRIAYHERKLAEELGASGQSDS